MTSLDRIERRAVIKFCFEVGRTPTQTLKMMKQSESSEILSRMLILSGINIPTKVEICRKMTKDVEGNKMLMTLPEIKSQIVLSRRTEINSCKLISNLTNGWPDIIELCSSMDIILKRSKLHSAGKFYMVTSTLGMISYGVLKCS